MSTKKERDLQDYKEITVIYGGRIFNNKTVASYAYYLDQPGEKLDKIIFKTPLVKGAGIGLKISARDYGGGTWGAFKSLGEFTDDQALINRCVAQDSATAYQIAHHRHSVQTPENRLSQLRKEIKDLTKGMDQTQKKHFVAGLFADLIHL